MRMLREAILLLRRSKGERTRSLQLRLLAFFALFLIIIVAAGYTVLSLAGVFRNVEQRHHTWLDTEIGHMQNMLSTNLNKLALGGVSLGKNLASGINAWSLENGITEKEISSHQALIESLLSEQAAVLLAAMENNDCSGAFIILEATVNPSAPAADVSKAGIYFKRTEPNTVTPIPMKTYCLRGSATIARENGIELMGQWKMEFNVAEKAFYESVMRVSRENIDADLSRLYYWSGRYLMDGNSEHCILLVVPLIASDGTIYGICGIEMSAMLYKRMYSPDNSIFPRVFSTFAPAYGDDIDTGEGLIAGNSYLTSQTTGLMTKRSTKSRDSWVSAYGGEYIGRAVNLRLYPSGSPYENEIWSLAVLLPMSDWDLVVNQGNTVLYGAAAVLLIISFFSALFISRRYIRPVVSALELIKSGESDGKPRTQIAEIDDLLEYLSAMDDERTTLREERRILDEERAILSAQLDMMQKENANNRERLSARRLRISQQELSLHKASVSNDKDPQQKDPQQQEQPLNAHLSPAYQRFLENLNTLTVTEQAVFKLYMQNYSARQIEAELFISSNTVKYHNKNIYQKLGVSSLKELKIFINMMGEVQRSR